MYWQQGSRLLDRGRAFSGRTRACKSKAQLNRPIKRGSVVPFALPGNEKMKTTTPSPSGRAATVLVVSAILWFTSIVAVLAWIGIYSNTPSTPAQPPEQWPEQSQLLRVPGRPNLVMFVHPRCPCSRASLGELERLLGRDRGLGSVQVVFANPSGKTADWAKTDLWQQATTLAGVAVYLDQNGVETKRFGVETSGQILLYAAAGELLFKGGITLSRGHSGDNPGRMALEDLLANKVPSVAQTPTFGCPLFAAVCEKGELACHQ